MPPADRTHPVILDHLDAVLAVLDDAALPWPVGEWQRPEDLSGEFVEPPYALVRPFPSAGQFEGPLSDSQTDIVWRFQIIGVGLTERGALSVTDLCRVEMQAKDLVIPSRYVQSLKLMVVAGGISRDDDLPIPFHNSSDLYEMQTTPA